MKTLKIIIIALLAVVLGMNSNACTQVSSKAAVTKTEKLKVSGNCEQCKARIEKAAKSDGVTKAEWSTETKILVVTYDPAKTNLDQIGKKVAASGHDNEKAKADDKTFRALPGCCKYR
jgi:periplasmic mercuric ion binding protein